MAGRKRLEQLPHSSGAVGNELEFTIDMAQIENGRERWWCVGESRRRESDDEVRAGVACCCARLATRREFYPIEVTR